MFRTLVLLSISIFLATVGSTSFWVATGSTSEIAAEFNLHVPMSSFASFGAAGPVSARGQSFVAEVSGRVESVGLRIARTSDHDLKFRISIQNATDKGEPIGDPLMTQDFPASLIPVNSIVDPVIFTFDNGANLQADAHYALTFRPAAYLQSESPFYLNAAANEAAAYEGGSSMRSEDNGVTWILVSVIDYGFRVTVDETVPVEPASWGSIKRRLNLPPARR